VLERLGKEVMQVTNLTFLYRDSRKLQNKKKSGELAFQMRLELGF
jgi:hypothetical protein